MEYIESKKLGDIAENEILKRVLLKYPNAYIDNTGKPNSKWDIYIPEIKEGIEVKMDYKSVSTNNIIIEVEMFNKPSALSITKSRYWVIITGYRYIWIKPLEIYRFLEQHSLLYNRVTLTGSGDYTSKKAYLINHDDFIKWVYNLNDDDGWVDMIKINDVLFYDNIIKKIK